MRELTARAKILGDYSDWLLHGLSGRWAGRVALLIALAIAAWVFSLLFWRLLLPAGKAIPAELALEPRAAVGQIVERHWFGSGGSTGVPAASPATVSEVVADIKLRGVIAPSRTRSAGMAILSVQGGPDKMFAVGEEVSAGVTLVRVRGNFVIVSRSGREEPIELPKRGRP